MHEYQRRLILASKNGYFPSSGGTLYLTTVAHDGECPALTGNGECKCDPCISVFAYGPGKNPPMDRPDKTFFIDSEGKRKEKA